MSDPTVLVVNEHEEIELPQTLLAEGGIVHAFSEALEKDYFTIRSKKGRLVLQAGGYVGVIPINGNLLLDIRPKVPLGNLERVLLHSESGLQQFKKGKRKYSTSKFSPKAVSDFLWSEFLEQAELVHELGLLKVYTESTGAVAVPKGRIFPFQSALISQISGRPKAQCAWQSKTANTGPNRLIKYLLHLLHRKSQGSPDKNLRRRVSFCLSQYDAIPLDLAKTFMQEKEVYDPSCIPASRDHYRNIMRISHMILSGHGVGFMESTSTAIEATSLLINMEVVLEDYIRSILRSNQELVTSGVSVHNGNKAGNDGAKQPLLKETDHTNQIQQKILATPDVVLRKNGDVGASNIVLDVKYKSVKKLADRADINQVIAYAASYGSKSAVLVYPSSNGNHGLMCLGAFDKTTIFQYFLDLTNLDFDAEEKRFAKAMASLFD